MQAPQGEPTSFEWLPDGRIVYAVARSLVFTKMNSAEFSQGITLPDTREGHEVRYLAVSPNGKEIAFTIVTDSTMVDER